MKTKKKTTKRTPVEDLLDYVGFREIEDGFWRDDDFPNDDLIVHRSWSIKKAVQVIRAADRQAGREELQKELNDLLGR